MHAEERNMLEAQITYWSMRKADICVLTHHMPSHALIAPRFAGHSLNDCFASACESLMTSQVRAWIYGHTHSCGTQRIRDTMCHVNARGYANERVPGFAPDAWCEFVRRSDTDDACDADLAAAATGVARTFAEAEDVEFM
jgi:hypothetical protein